MLAKIAWGNVRKSLGDFGVYFVTVMLAVAVFYAFNSMTAQRGVLDLTEQQSAMLELLGTIIGGVSVFIGCVLVFLVVYANTFLIRRRKREFGLYLLLGMGARSVVGIVLLESLMVGAASLICGLALGVGLSQAMLLLTSALFQAPVAADHGLAFVLSVRSLLQTACVFGAIFALAAALNVRTVSRAKLIDLMQASRRVETQKLRSIPVSLALFAVSLVMIGVAYKLLVDNGLMDLSPQFTASVVLVCAGTALFFFSLSGFLVRIAKLVPSLYLRSLTPFTVQQLASRVNTAFASLTVVCMVLFLALTSVCSGLGLRDATESSLSKGTPYGLSVTSYLSGVYAMDEEASPYISYAASLDYNMAEGLEQSLCTVGKPEAADSLREAFSSVRLSDNPDTWPVDMNISRIDCYQQNVGISAIVGYLAIYLGFVLVIACAAILSIQQLSEASDNVQRYRLLRKLGAPEGMLSRALFVQVLVYFLLPLLLAVAHSACAMYVVADVVEVFGRFEIGATAAFVAACFLAVYGVYFAITYLFARRFTRE